jgi:hypothetical protein
MASQAIAVWQRGHSANNIGAAAIEGWNRYAAKE